MYLFQCFICNKLITLFTDPTSDITLDNAHLHEAKYPPQLDLVTDTLQRHEEKKYNCAECYKVFLSEKGYKAHKEFHKRK